MSDDNTLMSHIDRRTALGMALRGLREAQGKKQGEIADPADYDAGNLSRVERGRQGIADDVLEKVCRQLGVSVADIHALTEQIMAGGAPDFHALPRTPQQRPTSESTLEQGPDVTQIRRAPKVGTAKLGMDGFYNELEHPTGHGDGYIEVPSRDPHVYCLRVRGRSMEPAIRDGWLVSVEPSHAPVPGEYVLLKLKDGRRTIKTFMYQRSDEVAVLSVSTDELHRFPLEEVDDIQYIGGVHPPSKLRL